MDLAQYFRLDGRIALVTGGSRGIGRMIAEGFIAQGAKVFISGRDAAACNETAAALGENCIALPVDISTVEGCRELAARLAEHTDRLDILVNNAGAAWSGKLDEFPEGGWDKVVDLNLKSPFFLTQALLGLLRAAATHERPGKIINIASVDGMHLNGWETYSYHASKAGVLHLTRRLAARLAEDHINVTAIAPGAFPSKMNRAATESAEALKAIIPANRIGRPEDMAAAAVYLAAPSGDYVMGHGLVVDGGVVHATIGLSVDA